MKNRSKKKLVSIIIPVFNEQEMIPLLFHDLGKELKKLSAKFNYEVIVVDDGSEDQTLTELEKWRRTIPHQVISFSRNFGHQAALLAGLEAAKGDLTITMDGDLQHPPSIIHQMLSVAEDHIDIVFTRRVDDDSISHFKKFTSGSFYRILNFFSSTHVPEAASDFRLLNRAALDALLTLPEKRIFLRGMVSWIGFTTKTIPFTAPQRMKGKSKYNVVKMIRLAVHGISSFSAIPLYCSAFMGIVFSLATVLYGIYVLYIRFVVGDAVAGWSSVIFVLLGMGSILSFLLAILGIYITALYDEVKQRPIYIIRK